MAVWLPETCPSCTGPTDAGFCAGCRADFSRSPMDEMPSAAGVSVLAPLRYEAPLDRYVHALKFHGGRRLGRALGLLLVEAARARAAHVDAVVPVPLHGARLRSRGYNQALEICRPLAADLRLPILLRGIRRLRETPPQVALGAADRARNLAGAFAVARDLGGRRVAIVDDVITTGATVGALAEALRAAGAAGVEAWAVAYTAPAGRKA